MALSLTDKLKIKEDQAILPVQAPEGFERELGKLPKGTRVDHRTQRPDQIHWFVKDRAQFEKGLERVLAFMGSVTLAWVYFPKGSSGIQTDLTRDKGWEKLLKQDDTFSRLTLISFNDTWSAFCFRRKKEAAPKKTKKPAGKGL